MCELVNSEACPRPTTGGEPKWEVKSIMERSFLGWVLRTDPAVAALGGEHLFSVLEYAEGAIKSFDLEETVDFATQVAVPCVPAHRLMLCDLHHTLR